MRVEAGLQVAVKLGVAVREVIVLIHQTQSLEQLVTKVQSVLEELQQQFHLLTMLQVEMTRLLRPAVRAVNLHLMQLAEEQEKDLLLQDYPEDLEEVQENNLGQEVLETHLLKLLLPQEQG